MTEKQQSFFEKHSVMLKVGSIGFLILILMIPMAITQSLVMERRNRQMEASTDISSKWGYAQQVTGPVLVIPYKTVELTKETESGKESVKERETNHVAYFLPDNLSITGRMSPAIRYRGIFQVAVYSASLSVKGHFVCPQIDNPNIKTVIDWSGAFVTIGISDLRGIRENITFTWNGNESKCEPGVKLGKMVKSGVTVKNLFQNQPDKADYQFAFDLELNGSGGLSFVPVGKVTNVSIASTWTNPSFDGSFLPESRSISSGGFEAHWKVLELNRNYPQQWVDDHYELEPSSFGVSLKLPMENYQITERSMKYSILFVSLTFLVFFFVEILRRMRVHPIQYGLVGLGLVLFYLLLLSLSEHMRFGIAYLIGSFGIIVLITSYSASILKSNRLIALLTSVLTLLYAFLYILLQLQDYALLMGSIGLFLILATVMYLSRKIDWYAMGTTKAEGGTN
jgi:inner membrane protein